MIFLKKARKNAKPIVHKIEGSFRVSRMILLTLHSFFSFMGFNKTHLNKVKSINNQISNLKHTHTLISAVIT